MTSSQTMELAVGLISRKKVQFGFLLQLFSVHSVQSAAAAAVVNSWPPYSARGHHSPQC